MAVGGALALALPLSERVFALDVPPFPGARQHPGDGCGLGRVDLGCAQVGRQGCAVIGFSASGARGVLISQMGDPEAGHSLSPMPEAAIPKHVASPLPRGWCPGFNGTEPGRADLRP